MQSNPLPSPQSLGFQILGVDPRLAALLEKDGITVPTPIQHQAIPAALQGKDLVGIAQTGTGKTFAFGLPMLQRLARTPGRGLVIVPTRELAQQIDDALAPLAALFHIRIATFVGGASMHLQRQMLRMNPRILVATPGRLNDHLQQRTVTLKEVCILVLDEADRMLDMGFKPQIDRILVHVPRERQTLLFSATMPREIMQLATGEMHLPLRIEVAPTGTTVAKVEQELIVVRQEDKASLLLSLLKEYRGSILVFSRTKHGAKKITRALNIARFPAAEIHANRSLAQRRAALAGFKSGTYRILVATDIASRGIDVMDIEVVINYDLPDDPADYVHRIGRTARAGREGRAISFATPNQAQHIRDIERLIRASLPRRVHSSLPALSLERDAAALPRHRPHAPRPPSPYHRSPRRAFHQRRSRR
ncbi:DEAD/DEAH box helicase [Candidatus Peregrinibacteria bacterium]|nr:DEAD/DEAH box helicase [Candidatus Peregrinibacteria bacterium]